MSQLLQHWKKHLNMCLAPKNTFICKYITERTSSSTVLWFNDLQNMLYAICIQPAGDCSLTVRFGTLSMLWQSASMPSRLMFDRHKHNKSFIHMIEQVHSTHFVRLDLSLQSVACSPVYIAVHTVPSGTDLPLTLSL